MSVVKGVYEGLRQSELSEVTRRYPNLAKLAEFLKMRFRIHQNTGVKRVGKVPNYEARDVRGNHIKFGLSRR